MARVPKWLTILLVLAAIIWGGWQLLVRNHHLSLIPRGLDVGQIIYVAERSWGFGPGGNETGIIVYKMPDKVATALEKDGVAHLKGLSPVPGGRWAFEEWQETPVVFDRRWPPVHNEGLRKWPVPGIASFIFRYGFSIEIDEDIEKFVNDALMNKGSYYGYNGVGGLIILIPAGRRIVFAYAG